MNKYTLGIKSDSTIAKVVLFDGSTIVKATKINLILLALWKK